MNCNVYEKLWEAVKVSKDLTLIRDYLSRGVNVKKVYDEDGSTLLHHADTKEIIRELYLRGANVNARNIFGDTPLHVALNRNRPVGIVKELLLYGASTGIRNNNGDTVMYLAVAVRNDLKITMELLRHSYETDIINPKRSAFSLDASNNLVYGSMACLRLFIKMITLKNYDGNYSKIIELANYIGTNLSELIDYMDECFYEIVKMKMDTVENYSIYDLSVSENGVVKPLYRKNKFTEKDIALKYPIYHEIIRPNIKLCLERGILLNKLRGIHGYLKSDTSSEENNLVLNPDCMIRIGMYLSNDDLWNFIEAFYRNIEKLIRVYSPNLFSHLNMRRKLVDGYGVNYGMF